MSAREHHDHPHLSGEHKHGHTIQLILLVAFLGIWISDSFIWHYSTFLQDIVPDYLRVGLAGLVLVLGWYLARTSMKAVFGTQRPEPVIIDGGVFKRLRHPMYTGALLFYLGSSLITLSLASALFWLVIIAGYTYISKYEERILIEGFGKDYLNYKKKTWMFFPKLF